MGSETFRGMPIRVSDGVEHYVMFAGDDGCMWFKLFMPDGSLERWTAVEVLDDVERWVEPGKFHKWYEPGPFDIYVEVTGFVVWIEEELEDI